MRAAPTGRTAIALVAVSLLAVWSVGLWYFDPWVAHNDFAVLRLRLERFLGGDPGLLGAHSRLEVTHPGPVREWLFAFPYWLSGRRAAALPATALVMNLSFVGAALVIAWRRRQQWIGRIAAVGGAVLVIAMRDQLDSPWNPHLAVLPLFVAAVATVVVLDGSRHAWILAVVAASVAGQLHASALVVAGALFVLVLVGEVRRDVQGWWRPVALGALLWIGPIVDLLRGSDANLVRLLTVDAGERVGLSTALSQLSRLVWPWTPLEALAIEPGTQVLAGWSRPWLLVVVGLIVVGIVRCERDLRSASLVSLVGVIGAGISIAAFVEPSYRYLYGPLQAIAVFALVTALAVAVARVAPEPAGAAPLGTLAVVVFVVALLGSLGTTSRHDHESSARAALALEQAVDRHLAAHPDWDTITLVALDVSAANPVAELADVLVRRGADPRSSRRELELAAPEAGGDAYVVAMGAALACLYDAGATALTEGTVPSVEAEIALFAVDLDAPGAAAPCFPSEMLL